MDYFNREYPLGGLLEQLNSAAVAVSKGIVREYNDAAARLLPSLREGKILNASGDGSVIELCGVRLNAVHFTVGNMEVYTFSLPSGAELDVSPVLLENFSAAMLESLNTALSSADLIANSAERAKLDGVGKYAAILRHSQYRLLHMAENLRELSVLERSPTALSPSSLDLRALCFDTVHTVETLIRDRGILLEFVCEEAEVPLYADGERIERMLLDLLANSVEHCAAGCRITVLLQTTEDSVQLLVRDNGAGIPPETFSRLFQTAQTPIAGGEPRGLGLSLLVARSIALRHNGNLVVSSPAGGGTEVLVSLPQLQDERLIFRTSHTEYQGKSMRPVLTAFADVLSYEYYAPPYL